MKTIWNGFKPQELIARGVFESLEELDAVMCAEDELINRIYEQRQEISQFTRGGCRGGGADGNNSFGTVGPVAPAFSTIGGGVSSAGIPKPHLLGAPPVVVDFPSAEPKWPRVVCVHCAAEAVMQGQGPAPRSNGDIEWVACERHGGGTAPTVAAVPARFPCGRW